MINKTCVTCNCDKSLESFYKATANKDGYTGQCKKCKIEYAGKYRVNNITVVLEKEKEFRLNNKDKIASYRKKHYLANKDKVALYKKEYQVLNREKLSKIAAQSRIDNPNRAKDYRQNNKARINSLNAKRRAKQLNATPAWADKDAIKRMYIIADFMKNKLGEDYQVDHIVPLQGVNVCGLHCESNLQLLTARENMSKGNRFA